MLQALGEHGGRVRKPLRIGSETLPVGAEISVDMARSWPKVNRQALARTNMVFWYPAPVPSTLAPSTTSPLPEEVAAEGTPPPAIPSGDSVAREPGGVANSPTLVLPIDPSTADRKELRRWLIAATGTEPPPALGEEKLRSQVREKFESMHHLPPEQKDEQP